MKEFLTFALLVMSVRELYSAEVQCEKIENSGWKIAESVKTCYVHANNNNN